MLVAVLHNAPVRPCHGPGTAVVMRFARVAAQALDADQHTAPCSRHPVPVSCVCTAPAAPALFRDHHVVQRPTSLGCQTVCQSQSSPLLSRTPIPQHACDMPTVPAPHLLACPSRRLLNRMNTPYHRSMDDNDNDDDGFSDGSDMLAQPSSSNGSEGDDERSDRPVGGSSSSSRPVGGHGASGSGHAAGPAFAGHSAGPAGPAPRVPPSAAERVLSPRQGAPAHVRMSVGHPAMVLAASSYKREAGPQAGGPGAKAGAGDDLDDVLGPLEGHGGRLSGAAVAVTRAQPWA